MDAESVQSGGRGLGERGFESVQSGTGDPCHALFTEVARARSGVGNGVDGRGSAFQSEEERTPPRSGGQTATAQAGRPAEDQGSTVMLRVAATCE